MIAIHEATSSISGLGNRGCELQNVKSLEFVAGVCLLLDAGMEPSNQRWIDTSSYRLSLLWTQEQEPERSNVIFLLRSILYIFCICSLPVHGLWLMVIRVAETKLCLNISLKARLGSN